MKSQSPLRVRLARNLRKQILRGHPWVYREALQNHRPPPAATLCELQDSKGEFLAWGIYDPHGPLAVRILSQEKPAPQNSEIFKRMKNARDLREGLRGLGEKFETNAFRLINGEGDLLPGLVCDVYSGFAVLQFDGQGPFEFWPQEEIAGWLLENTNVETVFRKPRHDSPISPKIWGVQREGLQEIRENGVRFFVDPFKGQKTGFFLDQRENRQHVGQYAKDKTLLNLFSYSGGFSVYGGQGGARAVTSVDLAQGAIDLANENWRLNSLDPKKHEGIRADVFQYMNEIRQTFDMIIVDPPSMASSEKDKPAAMSGYQDLFAQAARKVTPGGHLVLSSCSSHISFEDFFLIINEAVSKARRRGQILRVSGQGSDHPFPHACHELRYLKFAHLVLT